MVVPTGEWGDGWAATKAVEKAPMGSQHLVLTGKYHTPMRFLLTSANRTAFGDPKSFRRCLRLDGRARIYELCLVGGKQCLIWNAINFSERLA
jgi:hypothetical protein